MRMMGAFQGGGFQATTFPHYAIQQGIPYNVYGCVYIFSFLIFSLFVRLHVHVHCQLIKLGFLFTHSLSFLQ